MKTYTETETGKLDNTEIIEEFDSSDQKKEENRHVIKHIVVRTFNIVCCCLLLLCAVTSVMYLNDKFGVKEASLTDYLYHSAYGEDGEGSMNLYFDMNAYVRDTGNKNVAITYWASQTDGLSNGDNVDIYVYQDKGTAKERKGHISCSVGGLTTESESNILSSAMQPSND